MGRSVIVWGLALLAAVGSPASAQSGADKAAADTLFAEGRRRIAANEVEQACAKFEASLRKLSQLGTQIALAACYERLGKTASAWGAFRAAASSARKAGDEKRETLAEQRAAALESQLSLLAIKVEPGYRVDNLVVKRNGDALLAAELGTPFPVDPGEYAIEASAPGWVAWSTSVLVRPLPGTTEVVVPALGKAPVRVEEPAPVPLTAVVSEPATGDRARRIKRLASFGLGAGGAALLGGSLIAGAVARSRWNESQEHCVDTRCTQHGVDLAHGAERVGTVSTGLFVVGLAALGTATYLFMTSRTSPAGESSPPEALETAGLLISPDVGQSHLGLSLSGGF